MSPTARDEFWYDPDGQRFLGRETWQSSGTKTALTVYLGAFEEVIPASGGSYNLVQRTDLTATVRHLRTRTTGGTIATRFEYVHRDHLGSVDAVTDSAGALPNNKTSYDAFAGRREANWTSDITSASLTTLVSNEDERFARGYTDHEQLNRTGFIHMNGRVYDPRIGRFVSADPIVQSPIHSQSYNRYSYTFNSPLSYVDPSGYEPTDHPNVPIPSGPNPGWVSWQGNPGPAYYALENRSPATMDRDPHSPSQPSPLPGEPTAPLLPPHIVPNGEISEPAAYVLANAQEAMVKAMKALSVYAGREGAPDWRPRDFYRLKYTIESGYAPHESYYKCRCTVAQYTPPRGDQEGYVTIYAAAILHTDASVSGIARTVLHEFRHSMRPHLSEAEGEEDAEKFADEVMKYYEP